MTRLQQNQQSLDVQNFPSHVVTLDFEVCSTYHGKVSSRNKLQHGAKPEI